MTAQFLYQINFLSFPPCREIGMRILSKAHLPPSQLELHVAAKLVHAVARPAVSFEL